MSKRLKGIKLTEERKDKIRRTTPRGKKHPLFGKQRSQTVRSKISLKLRGQMTGKRNPFYGMKHTSQTKAKMSANHADFSGSKNPFWGQTHSREAIERAIETKRTNGTILSGTRSPSYGKHPAKGAGRCRWTTFRSKLGEEVPVQGSFEYWACQILDKMGLAWSRNHRRFTYHNPLRGRSTYSPDFVAELGGARFYIEVKGYIPNMLEFLAKSQSVLDSGAGEIWIWNEAVLRFLANQRGVSLLTRKQWKKMTAPGTC